MKLLAAVAFGVAVWMGMSTVFARYAAHRWQLERLRRSQPEQRRQALTRQQRWLGAIGIGVVLGALGLGWWQLVCLVIVADRGDSVLAEQRRQREQTALLTQLPTLWLLVAAGHQAGLSLPQVVTTLSERLTGEVGRHVQALQAGLAAGQSLREALPAVQQRAGADFERGWRLALQAEALGTPVVPLLHKLSAQATQQLRWQEDTRLARLPLWLTLVTVCCFLPGVFVVTVLPQVLGFIAKFQ